MTLDESGRLIWVEKPKPGRRGKPGARKRSTKTKLKELAKQQRPWKP